MKLKETVRILGVRPEVVLGMFITESTMNQLGFPCVITSVTDGTHSRGSIHYSGGAWDVRIRNIPDDAWSNLVFSLKQALGGDFDVVLENDHIHCEFQPKNPY
jgi:hypothetical protein